MRLRKQKYLLLAHLLVLTCFLVGAARPQDPWADMRAQPDGNLSDDVSQTAPKAVTDAHYLDVPSSTLLSILDDPKGRVPDDFKVPEGMRHIVGFWLKIYAKYSLYHTIIYDRDHHDIVYDVVDSRALFKKGLSPVALEITTRNRVRSVVSGYRAAIKQLQKNPRMKFKAGTPGANLVRLWGTRTPAQWRRIAEAIRTQTGQRDRILDGLLAADRFFPGMESIFKKFGVPEVITRLPLVESSFNVQAKSKAAAVGVWQFLEKSAQEYLVVDKQNKIDERLSPIKSTYAAARMFKRNYHLLQDWGLAIIAYNHGAKNLLPIRKKFKGEKISKLLRMTEKTPLGYASRSFYACFLAVLHAERYRDDLYGIAAHQHSDAISIVKMKKPASIFEVASLYNISIHELRLFNPDIFDLNRKLPAGTRVVLPRKHGESLVETPKMDPLHRGQTSGEKRGIASDVEFIEYIQ